MSASAATPAEPPAAWLRRLWERMIPIYGHRWASVQGVSPQDAGTGAMTVTGETWAKGLAGLSGTQLGAGLEACITRNDDWPPSLPEFRALCLGIPEFARVRIEVTQPAKTRSPFTTLVWTFVDAHAYRHASGREGERILREAYDLAREQRMRGAALPEIAGAVSHEAAVGYVPPPVAHREALIAATRRQLFGDGVDTAEKADA